MHCMQNHVTITCQNIHKIKYLTVTTTPTIPLLCDYIVFHIEKMKQMQVMVISEALEMIDYMILQLPH